MNSKRRLPRNVIALGLVSLFTDISSEMLYPIIPLFLAGTLGATPVVIGLIEGLAEMTASLMNALTGHWSDRRGVRRPFVLFGYSLSAAGKAALAFSTSWAGVLFARVADRFGKGTRGTARDAMLAESIEPERRGLAFGFHRSMDQVGAVAGPLLGLWLLGFIAGDYRKLFLLSLVPAIAGVALVFTARETGTGRECASAVRPVLRWSVAPQALRRYLLVWGLFSLGNSADAFLLLRAKHLGASDQDVILLFAIFNAATVLCALPAGIVSDRLPRKNVVATGLLVFALVYLAFGAASSPAVLWLLFAIYGIYAGIAQGAGRALIVDLVPPEQKAAALGWHGAMTGVLGLCASLLAGILWQTTGASMPFYAGGWIALASALLLVLVVPASRQRESTPASA